MASSGVGYATVVLGFFDLGLVRAQDASSVRPAILNRLRSRPRRWCDNGIILLVVLIIAVGIHVARDTTEISVGELDPIDRRALKEYSEYAAAVADSPESAAWLNAAATERPTLLISRKSQFSYLINPSQEVSSPFAAPIDMGENPAGLEVYRLDRFYPRLWPIKVAGGNFNTVGETTTVQGSDVYYLKFGEDNFDKQFSSEHFITFFAHESFHFYGQARWALDSRVFGELSPHGVELLDERMRLLDDVRDAGADQARLRELAAELLALEKERLATDPDYVSQERWMETGEGTATYLGIEAARAVGYDFGPMYFGNTKEARFTDVIPFLKAGQIDNDFLRNRLPYEAGAQLCLLLAAIAPATKWQAYLNEQSPDSRRTLIDALGYVLDQ